LQSFKSYQSEFKISLTWGQYGEIEVILAKWIEPHRAQVMCKWVVKGNIINQALMEVMLETMEEDSENMSLSNKNKMLVQQLSVPQERISYNSTDVSHYRSEFVLYGDMMRHDGFLRDESILEIFEHTRAELFGGQQIMREIMNEDSLLIVVHSMMNFNKKRKRKKN